MIQDLLKRLRSGKVTQRNLDTFKTSKFRKDKALTNALNSELLTIGEAGHEHVNEELTRQEADV
jgi:uncharacterized protein with HEPN domain